MFAAAPGLAQIESNVVRWFADLAGLPPGAGGILTSGGSLATFSALVAARRDRLPENFFPGTLYASDQTHHALQKAAVLAGFPAENVREIPTDDAYRMRVPALAEAIAADRAAGRTPFFVGGNAGTTNTGAVDDLAALAELAARERLWFHVDGAYGGFFLLTGEGRRRMAGIERADSIVLDPHKGLFLPYGTGALLVRDVETLRRAHALSAEYLPSMQQDPDLVDFNMLSPELSRDFRGLRVWLPLKMHGIGPFRTNLEEKLALARHAARELARMPGVEILAEPQLSILAFRLARPGLDPAALDALNRELLDRINGAKAHLPDRHAVARPLRHPHLRPVLPHPPRPAGRRPGGHPGRGGGASKSVDVFPNAGLESPNPFRKELVMRRFLAAFGFLVLAVPAFAQRVVDRDGRVHPGLPVQGSPGHALRPRRRPAAST